MECIRKTDMRTDHSFYYTYFSISSIKFEFLRTLSKYKKEYQKSETDLIIPDKSNSNQKTEKDYGAAKSFEI